MFKSIEKELLSLGGESKVKSFSFYHGSLAMPSSLLDSTQTEEKNIPKRNSQMKTHPAFV